MMNFKFRSVIETLQYALQKTINPPRIDTPRRTKGNAISLKTKNDKMTIETRNRFVAKNWSCSQISR